MALVDFRFKKTEAVNVDELNAQLTITAAVQDNAGGNIVTIRADDTEEADLTDYMTEQGYVLTEGAGGAGVTGVASDDEDRRLLQAKNAVRACTTADLIAAGWVASGSGRGKTLTSPTDATSNNDFDTVTLVAGDRLLNRSGVGANATSNGLYEMTTPADGAGQNAVLTRTFDFDDDEEVQTGSEVLVLEGATCTLRKFIMNATGPITVDTTQLTFVQPATAAEATDSFMFGANTVASSQTDRFLYPSYNDDQAQTQAIQFRVPRGGTFQSLRVRHNDPRGNGNAIVYTLRVNGTPTSLSVSLASTANDGSDLVNSAVVLAGDLIDVIVTKAAGVGSSPRDIVASVEFAA